MCKDKVLTHMFLIYRISSFRLSRVTISVKFFHEMILRLIGIKVI